MRRILASVLATVVCVAAAAADPPPKSSPKSSSAAGAVKLRRAAVKKEDSTPKPYQIGSASWYGKKFHGRLTASGETYDMFQFTAAHKELPLGTFLKVTNIRNGKWVVVKVNDRGPYSGNRVLDLSYGAAQMLGMKANGIAKVRLDIVQEPDDDQIEVAANLPARAGD